MVSMKSLKLWVRKLSGQQSLLLQAPVSSLRGMPRQHAGSSVHHRHPTRPSQRTESTQKHRGLVIFLPTSRYFTYPALGNLQCLWFFCFHTGIQKHHTCIVLFIRWHECLVVPDVQMEKGKNRCQRHSNAIQEMQMSPQTLVRVH